MKQIKFILLFTAFFLASHTSGAQSINKYSESASNFDRSPVLNNSSYPESAMYRAYKKGRTGGASLNKLQNQVEEKIRGFAKKEGKAFVILGQRTSSAPYIFGNYPRVEIIFALIE